MYNREKVTDETYYVHEPSSVYYADQDYQVGMLTESVANGGVSWDRSMFRDPFSPSRIAYLNRQNAKFMKRLLRNEKRRSDATKRLSEYHQYLRENRKEFNSFRLRYLDAVFTAKTKATQLAEAEKSRVSSNFDKAYHGKKSGRRYRSYKRAYLRENVIADFRFHYLQLKPEYDWVAPLPFPKRLRVDPGYCVLNHNERLKKPKKLVENFCNNYNAVTQNTFFNVFGQYVDRYIGQGPRTLWFAGIAVSALRVPRVSPVIFGPNEEIKLLQGLGVKWRKHELNLQNSLAESDEVYFMFVDCFKKLTTFIEHLVRKDFFAALSDIKLIAHPNRVLKTLAKGVLLEIYGIEPLLSDVYNAAEAFASLQIEKHSKPYTIRHSESVFEEFEDEIPVCTGQYNAMNEFLLISGTQKITRRLVARLLPSSEPSVWQSMGLDDPIQGMYEAAPFSFLVEWVLKIQATLEAENFVKSSSIDRAFYSTKRTTVYTKVAINPDIQLNFPVTHMYDFPEIKRVSFRREEIFELTVPRPELRSISKFMTQKHLLVSISLIITFLKLNCDNLDKAVKLAEKIVSEGKEDAKWIRHRVF